MTQTDRRRGIGLALLAVLALGTIASAAEEPAIDVAVSAGEIFVGESIDYQVEIRNVENPEAPDVSAVREQFDVVPNGDQSRNQSSTFIVNGRMTQQNSFSHIYLYRLTPKITGKLTIPAVKTTSGTNVLTSQAVELRVMDAEEQDLVLFEVQSDRASVYPTQPFTVTLKVLVQPLPEKTVNPLKPLRRQPPNLQLNWVDVPEGLIANDTSKWLQPLLSNQGLGFTINDISASSGSFFGGSRAAVFDLTKGRETRDGLDGTPIEYFVFELSRGFTAKKPGIYLFGPAIVKGTFVGGTQGSEYTARRLVAIAPAINVEVREVPSPRPATYTGGIGEYQVKASATPLKLRVGDPLTLTLEFTPGKDAGSLELISAPDLAAVDELVNGFEIIDKAPTGRVEGNVKRFAYALRPKRPGVTVPSLALLTFDPATEKFADLVTAPVSLDVAEVSKLSSKEIVGAMPAAPSSGIQKSASGIFQNVTNLDELRDERIDVKQWAATVAGFWCLMGCLLAGMTMHRRKSTDTIGQRRSKARRAALSKLSEASQLVSDGQSKVALRRIRSAFVGLVADTKNRVIQGLTTSDVETALVDASVSETDRLATRHLLESIENAEYGAGDTIDVAAAIESGRSLIDRISPLLERSAVR